MRACYFGAHLPVFNKLGILASEEYQATSVIYFNLSNLHAVLKIKVLKVNKALVLIKHETINSIKFTNVKYTMNLLDTHTEIFSTIMELN